MEKNKNFSEENITFVSRKTDELSSEEMGQLIKLYNETMDDQRTEKEFKAKYLYNFLGFSFHGLMKLGERIIGCYTVIPYEFVFFSKQVSIGQWCETLIHKDFRGSFSNFKKLGDTVNENLKKSKIFFIYALPNRQIYVVSKRLLGMKDIGKLSYYVYPNNLKKFFIKFYPFNILFGLFLKFLTKIKPRSNYKYKFSIYKICNDKFNYSRYGENQEYKVFSDKNYKLVYKIENSKKYDNAKIIWIIDVFPLTEINLESSVNKLKSLNEDVDLIVYIGDLEKIPKNLFKVPENFLKRQSIFTGKILDSSQIQEAAFKMSNWNINLSNFDHK